LYLRHFEELRPLCPRCLASQDHGARLVIATIEQRTGDDVVSGVLRCTRDTCRQDFPIIDGIPIVVPDVAQYLADNLWHITARTDLPEMLEIILGEATGPGSAFDVARYHLGTYAFDHWGEFDPLEDRAQTPGPGSVARCLNAGIDLLGDGALTGPGLDIGCSVGRSTFELAARSRGLVLGIDLNFSMLRLARRVLTDRLVTYPRRRIGIVYDRRTFEVPVEHPEWVDFWVCDAMAPPFPPRHFGLISALNVLDCLPDPAALLAAIGAGLQPGGGAVLATPYDWSAAATQPRSWIGGQSPRDGSGGAAEPGLRALLARTNGLRIAREDVDFPWHVRLHDRSTMAYSTHLIAIRSESPEG
jgi:SAM-dependent methyltransferase